MSGAFALHDADAILDYGFDWSAWLAEEATIAQSEWSAPTGVTLSQEAVVENTTAVRVAIDDADLIGTTVKIVNHVTSSDGQEDDRTLQLYIGQR